MDTVKTDKIIKRFAIEFINCYWNVPYKQFTILLEAIQDDYEDVNSLEDLIKLLNKNVSECCYILSNYAIEENHIFGFFNNRMFRELVNISDTYTDWFLFVNLAGKLFVIGDDNYKIIEKKQKTIEYYEVVK